MWPVTSLRTYYRATKLTVLFLPPSNHYYLLLSFIYNKAKQKPQRRCQGRGTGRLGKVENLGQRLVLHLPGYHLASAKARD